MKTVYTPSRALEWHCAWSALAVSVVLFLPGSTFAMSPSWNVFAEIMSENSWAVLIFCVAMIRFTALIVNGHWHRTPIARALTAAVGAALWGYMAVLFYQPELGGVAIGVGLTTTLAVSDCFSAWRSGRDAMIAWTVWKEGRRA